MSRTLSAHTPRIQEAFLLFIVQFEDVYSEQPERIAERMLHMPEHLAFLAAHGDRVLASGALRDSAEGVPSGGIWILNMESKSEAEAFYQDDPFWKAGLRKSVRVSHWGKAFWSPAFSDCIDSLPQP